MKGTLHVSEHILLFLSLFSVPDVCKSHTKSLSNSTKNWPRVSATICPGKRIALPRTLVFGTILHDLEN